MGKSLQFKSSISYEPGGITHRQGPWRSFEQVELATLKWVHWFNHKRLLEPIGYVPPVEAEANYYAALDQIPMAA